MLTNNKLSVLLAFALGMIGACHGHGPKENKALEGIRSLPDFTMLSLDSSRRVSSNNIPGGEPCVLFYFDPTCEHCKKETAGIVANPMAFRNVRLYFVTEMGSKAADSFVRTFKLDTWPNVFVGQDYQYTFLGAFLPSTIPYIAVYNGRRRLVKKYDGETDMNAFIGVINGLNRSNSLYAQ